MSVQGRMSVCGCMKRLQPVGMIHSHSCRTMQFFINFFSINSAAEVDNLCPRCLRLAPPSSPLCHCSSGQPHSKIVQGTDPEEIQLSRFRYFFPAISQLWFHSLRGYPGKGYLSKKGYCLSCFKYSQVLDWVYQFLIKEAKAKAFSFGVG